MNLFFFCQHNIYILLHACWATVRVPGLPIRDCARGCDHCDHTRPQLRTTDVTEDTFFERLYLVSGIGTFERQLYLCTYNFDRSMDNYFSISVQFFSPRGPSLFLVSPIHQVIWPNPGVHPKTLIEIAVVLSMNSVSFPSNSHVSATFFDFAQI